MVFEYILKKNGIDPKTDLTIDQSISFGLTAAAFTSDDSQYTVEFEPFATGLELEGNGYVVASLGTDSGYVPYTAYSAKKSYLAKNPEVIQKFTNAIQIGLNKRYKTLRGIHTAPALFAEAGHIPGTSDLRWRPRRVLCRVP